MTHRNYWIWLQLCLGAGARFKEIIDDFGSVENLYSSNIIEWKMSPALTSNQIERLQKFTLNDTVKIIDKCEHNGWQIITFDDEIYPQRLREISNPPAVLYIDGKLPAIDNYAVIGIVGTRKASTYATKCAHIMSKGISRCGAITISGGALGVDTAAHKGALEEKAPTLLVLGCGFGTDYLEANRKLRESIRTTGALITEFPPGTKASKTTFPIRNRIISGLSLGILVVEAGVKSGSLITANYANEQGRDVYVIPASIFDYNFQGSNKLIDDGATIATSPRILIERYADKFPTLDLSKMKTVRDYLDETTDKSANAKEAEQVTFDNIARDRYEAVKRQNKALELSGDEKAVFDAMKTCFESIDIISGSSGLESKRVLVALTKLEMKKLVEVASGKRYRRKQ